MGPSIPSIVRGLAVGCLVVVAVASGVGYALSRILIRIRWIRPARIGDSPAEQARHRAVQILQLHLTRAAAGYVIAFVVFIFFGSFLVLPVSLVVPGVLSLVGLIEGNSHTPMDTRNAVLLTMAMVHAPAQLIAYWLSVRHALWLG